MEHCQPHSTVASSSSACQFWKHSWNYFTKHWWLFYLVYLKKTLMKIVPPFFTLLNLNTIISPLSSWQCIAFGSITTLWMGYSGWIIILSNREAIASWITDAMKKNKSLRKGYLCQSLVHTRECCCICFCKLLVSADCGTFLHYKFQLLLASHIVLKITTPTLHSGLFSPISSWTVLFQSVLGKVTSDCFTFHWLQAPCTTIYSERQLLYQSFPSCLKLSWESIRKSEQTIVAFRRL